MRDVVAEMTRKKLGMTCVLDEDGRLAGIITDGDLAAAHGDRRRTSSIARRARS